MNVTSTSLHSYADAARPAGCARPRILGASMLALAAVPLETRYEGAVLRDGPNAFEDVFARMQV